MSAPTKWIGYDQAIDDLTKGLWDFTAGHAFKVALFTSASIAINHAANPATYTAFAADGHEVAASGGYSTGGVSVGALVRTMVSGQAQLALTNALWTCSGSGITWRAAVLYDSTDAGKRALAYTLGDSSNNDVIGMAGYNMVIPVGLFSSIQWG